MARIVVVAVAPRRLVSAPVVLRPRRTYVSTFPTGPVVHVVTGRVPNVGPGARPVFVRPNDQGTVTAPAVATVSPVHVIEASAVPVPAALPVFRRGALVDDPTATGSPIHVVTGYARTPTGLPIVLRPAAVPDAVAQPGTKPYVVSARPVLLAGRVVVLLPRQDGGPGVPVSTPGGCIRSTVLAVPGAALLEVDGPDTLLVPVGGPLADQQDPGAPTAAPAPASAATARTAPVRGPRAVTR